MAMTAEKANELILVTPRNELFEGESLVWQGAKQSNTAIGEKVLANLFSNLTMMRRGLAEENTKFKQPIPYAIIKRGDEIFVYKRLAGGGESRLHDKLSLGAGGHMNEVNGAETLEEVLSENLMRELEEELYIEDQDFKLTPFGLINDDENEVGRVHIGLLYFIEVKEGTDVTVRETDQLEGYWATLEDLTAKETYDKLESWSKISVDLLTGKGGVSEAVQVLTKALIQTTSVLVTNAANELSEVLSEEFADDKSEKEDITNLLKPIFENMIEKLVTDVLTPTLTIIEQTQERIKNNQ